MIATFFDLLFGCAHTNYTFPITKKSVRRGDASARTGTYVVCLDCGKEFAYDWKTMKVISKAPDAKPAEGTEVPAGLKAA